MQTSRTSALLRVLSTAMLPLRTNGHRLVLNWHLQKTIITERKHIPSCHSLVLSHDGRFVVASGHEDGVIILWSTQTDDIVAGQLRGHTGRVNDIAFSLKDKRIVTGSSDCTVRIWDCTNQKLVKFDGHPRSVELVICIHTEEGDAPFVRQHFCRTR